MNRISAAVAIFVAAGVYGTSAQQPAKQASPKTTRPATVSRPTLLPGTNANVIATIQGNALDSTNRAMPGAQVRLRDVRFGRVVETAVTDGTGLFTFRLTDPGSYVVELVGDDQTILAASQILNVDAGQVLSAIVKLPFRIPLFAGLLGRSAGTAAIVFSAAAASGVMASQVTANAQSPRR